MQCQTVRELLISYARQELADAVAADVAAHLEACPACRDEARALDAVYADLPHLPVFPLAYDLAAIETEATRRMQRRTLQFWTLCLVPVAACAVVLLLVFGFRPSTPSQIIVRHVPAPRHGTPVVPPTAIIARLSPNPATPPVAGGVPTPSVPAKAHPRPAAPGTRPAPPTPAGDTVITRCATTLARCMAPRDGQAAATCAFQPILATDSGDLPAADTLTASLLTAFKAHTGTVAVQCLPPVITAPDDLLSLAQSLGTGAEDYVVVGRLAKAESGYVLSLYAIDTRDGRVIFDGSHPMLLPPDSLPQKHLLALAARAGA
jgi:hypothetical protein